MPNKILGIVLERYGSINNFIYKKADVLKSSRTRVYQLLTGEHVNPTVETLIDLANALELPKEEVINDYVDRYRVEGPKGKHTD